MTDATEEPLALRADDAVHRHDHVVQFYDHDDELVASLVDFVAGALLDGGTVVLYATRAHTTELLAAVAASGVDVDTARTTERLIVMEAEAAAAALVDGGRFRRDAFDDVVGDHLRRAVGHGRPVHVYGEIVGLFWDDGHVPAAIELETLWNGLADELPFVLRCAYRSAAPDGDADAVRRVCDLHTAVLDDPAPARATRAFPASPSTARAARGFVAGVLERWDLAGVVDDATLVTSELVTNAVLHGGSGTVVTVTADRARVRIDVADDAAATPVVQAESATRATGRGLVLVGGIAATWGVEPKGRGKVVWAELRR